jgi:hypothetical protein
MRIRDCQKLTTKGRKLKSKCLGLSADGSATIDLPGSWGSIQNTLTRWNLLSGCFTTGFVAGNRTVDHNKHFGTVLKTEMGTILKTTNGGGWGIATAVRI